MHLFREGKCNLITTHQDFELEPYVRGRLNGISRIELHRQLEHSSGTEQSERFTKQIRGTVTQVRDRILVVRSYSQVSQRCDALVQQS